MKINCGLCFHNCGLDEGETGFCLSRKNKNGKIVSLNYGRLTSIALDPIEKKPLRRFYPGSLILSVGSFGCNLKCPFCQNWEISAVGEEANTVYIEPEKLAAEAFRLREQGNIGVAYTYNEPLISYEFVKESAEKVHGYGMKNVLVTNGTIEEKYFEELMPFIDALNIDLKGFNENWYRRLGGELETVKQNIITASKSSHLEVTTLLVTNENDSENEIRQLSKWLSSVDPEIPLHLSRFFPNHRMIDKPPTPVNTVYSLAETAREYLKFVYTGNC